MLEVHETWKNRLLEATSSHSSFEVSCNQVKRCIGIALDCLKSNRQERPTIQHIISILNEDDIMKGDRGTQNEQVGQDDGDSSTLPSDVSHIANNSRPLERVDSELLYSEYLELLRVQPQELFFPFMSPLPRKKAMISCSLQLINKEKDRVAFMLVANNPKRYLTKKPLFGVVPPSCVYTLSLTMPKQPRPMSLSSSSSSDTRGGDDFFTLHSVAVSEYKLRYFDKDSLSIKYKELFEEARKNTVAGEGVHEVTLKASICDRPAGQGTSSSSEIITMPDAQQVSSIDVHPTEPWYVCFSNVVMCICTSSYRTTIYKYVSSLVPLQNIHVQDYDDKSRGHPSCLELPHNGMLVLVWCQ
jgi:coatomer subunit beta'